MEAAGKCIETADRAKALGAREARQTAIARGVNALSWKFLDAIKQQDLTLVHLPTPEFADKVGGVRELNALSLVRDLLDDTDGDELLQRMVHLIAAASRGEPVQMQCTSFLARMAGVYAERHGAAFALGEDA